MSKLASSIALAYLLSASLIYAAPPVLVGSVQSNCVVFQPKDATMICRFENVQSRGQNLVARVLVVEGNQIVDYQCTIGVSISGDVKLKALIGVADGARGLTMKIGESAIHRWDSLLSADNRVSVRLLSVSGSQIVDGTYTVTFIFGSSPPPTPPDPAPPTPPTPPDPAPPTPPDPTPPTPPSVMLRDLVKSWAEELVPSGYQRRSDAVKLSEAFTAIADKIKSGELKSPTEIVAASTAANREALGVRRDVWRPWAERLAKYLDAEADAGRLVTVQQYEATWREIAVGLMIVMP